MFLTQNYRSQGARGEGLGRGFGEGAVDTLEFSSSV